MDDGIPAQHRHVGDGLHIGPGGTRARIDMPPCTAEETVRGRPRQSPKYWRRTAPDDAITRERSADLAAQVAQAIEASGQRGIAIEEVSADPEAVKRAVADTVAAMGGLDILVNSAAVGREGMVADFSLADINAMLDINARGPLLFAHAAISHFNSGGRIISIGSAPAQRVPFPGATAHAMTRSALLAFTRSLSRGLGPGVRP